MSKNPLSGIEVMVAVLESRKMVDKMVVLWLTWQVSSY
jgi:hypothetical protein